MCKRRQVLHHSLETKPSVLRSLLLQFSWPKTKSRGIQPTLPRVSDLVISLCHTAIKTGQRPPGHHRCRCYSHQFVCKQSSALCSVVAFTLKADFLNISLTLRGVCLQTFQQLPCKLQQSATQKQSQAVSILFVTDFYQWQLTDVQQPVDERLLDFAKWLLTRL